VNYFRPGWITGLFFDYWLQFACGLLLHERLCLARTKARARLLDLVLILTLALIATDAYFRGQFHFVTDRYQFSGQLTVCLVFAVVLLLLRRFDAALKKTLPLRVLSGLGAMSYSLYLIHYPTAGCLRSALLERWGHVLLVDTVVLVTVVVMAYVFYRIFERPFLNKPEPASSNRVLRERPRDGVD
jgi:peptidoglycan/LPS O-acetylase OafA/YrhL